MHSLLDAGSKSVSHLEKLLDKFNWLLNHVAKDTDAKVLVLSAVAGYYARYKQMLWIAVRRAGLPCAPAPARTPPWKACTPCQRGARH